MNASGIDPWSEISRNGNKGRLLDFFFEEMLKIG